MSKSCLNRIDNLIGRLSHATSILIGSFGFGINYHLLIFPILYLILNSNFSATYGVTFFSTLIQLTPVLSTFTVLVIHALLHSFFWAIPCVGGRPSTLLLNQVYHYCILSLPVGVLLSIYNNKNNKSETCNGDRIKAVAKTEQEEIAIDKVCVST